MKADQMDEQGAPDMLRLAHRLLNAGATSGKLVLKP